MTHTALKRRVRVGRTRPRTARGNLWVALGFLAPALIALALLRLLPAGVSLVESLYRTSILNPTPTFVGLQNYTELFTNAGFQQSILVTLIFSIIINPLQVVASFLLAVLFTRRTAGSRIWRSLVIVPIAVPPAVSAVVWSVIYRPDGLANSFLSLFGIPDQPFLSSAQQALPAVIVLLCWVGVGYWMLFLCAGINDIPQEIFEAADLDGASGWRKTWAITLPMVRRPLGFVLVATTVANFTVFAPIQILTKGGPSGSTNLLMYDLYNRAYSLGDLNTAQAEVLVLVLITLAVVAIQFRMMRSAD
ncbi:carbohydrate ABC transporter permease [Leucobacter sp. HY1910]